MWGSVNSPSISGFELREAIGQLTNAIIQGAVDTPLTTSAGEPLCTAAGEPLTARQTRQTQEGYTDIPSALWPIVEHIAAAEGAEVERRVTDNLMGAIMTGRLAATLTDRAGAALATRRGETLVAHQNTAARNSPETNNLAAEVALLFKRMAAYDTLADDIMGAILAGNISATMSSRAGQALSTRRGETLKAYR